MIILEVASKQIFKTRIIKWRACIAPPFALFLGYYCYKVSSFTFLRYLMEQIAQLKVQKLKIIEKVLILTRSASLPAPESSESVLDKLKNRDGITYTVWKQN